MYCVSEVEILFLLKGSSLHYRIKIAFFDRVLNDIADFQKGYLKGV
jgi:hypothetical protein